MNHRPGIGFVCSSRAWGGLEMNTLRLAGWLAERGWPVVIYGRTSSPLLEQAAQRGLTCGRVDPATRYGGPLTAWSLARQVQTDGVRIIAVNTNRDLFYTGAAGLLRGRQCHLLLIQHMQLGRDKKDRLHTWAYNHLDAWVSPLDILAADVARRTRINRAKVRVVPFGIELDRFTGRLPDRRSARKRLSLPEEDLLLGVIGRLDPKKGQDVLVRAMAHLDSGGRAVSLILAGDETAGETTGYKSHLRKLAASAGLDDRLVLLPHRERIEDVYAALDIFVLTSHAETYGMVTIEAMASGLPIVATDSGGTPGIVQHEINGLLVPPEDPRSLGEALTRLIGEPDLAAALADRARRDAVTRYSHETQCRLYEDLFGELLASPAEH